MTPEERRKLQKDLDNAMATKRRIQTQMENDAAKCKKMSDAKSELSSRKKNLEARLEDVKQILSLLDGSVTSHISDANRSAVSAGEKYVEAIICSTITSSSIQEAYKTHSVQSESNSCDTYDRCKAEKRRLEEAIIQIQEKIREVDAKIAALESGLRSAANSYADISRTVNRIQGQLN